MVLRQSRGLKMDKIEGWQDLQDRVLMLSGALTMDRMAGLRDLQGSFLARKT